MTNLQLAAIGAAALIIASKAIPWKAIKLPSFKKKEPTEPTEKRLCDLVTRLIEAEDIEAYQRMVEIARD